MSPLLLPLTAAALAVPRMSAPRLSRNVDLRARPDAPVAEVRCYTSGMRVAIAEDHRAPWVGTTLVLDGGQAHDPEGKRGLAHLTEHLQFQAQVGGARMADRIAGLGLEHNAMTTAELTLWPLEGPAPRLGDMLTLHAERLRAAPLDGVDEALLAQEKAAVHHERADRGFSITHAASDWLTPLVYPDGAAPLPRGPETHGSVDAIELADARAFAERWFQPQHTTLVVRGDVEPDATFAAVEAAFGPDLIGEADPGGGSCTRRHLGIRPVVVGEQTGAPPHHEATVFEPTVLVGWGLPGRFDPRSTALHGVGRWQEDRLRVLVDNLVEGDLDEEAEPDCRVLPGARGSLLACVVPVAEGYHPDDFALALQYGLGRLRVDETEPRNVLALGLRLKRQRARRAWGHLSPLGDGSAIERDMHLHMTGRGDWLRGLETAGVARDDRYHPDLAALAADPGVAVVLEPPPLLARLRLPAGVPALIDPDTARAAVSGGSPAAGGDIGKLLAAVPSGVAPPLGAPDRRDAAEVHERVLDNGVRIRVLPRSGPATVRVTARRRHLDELAPESRALADHLTAWRALALHQQRPATPHGAARQGGLEVDSLFDGRTWALSVAGDADQLSVIATITTAQLRDAVVDEDFLPWARGRLRGYRSYLHSDPWATVFSAALAHVYADDPALSPRSKVAAALDARTSKTELRRIERARGATEGSEIIVVGNVDPDDALDLFADALSGWSGPTPPEHDPEGAPTLPPMPEGPTSTVRVDRGDDRATLVAACRLPDRLATAEAEAVETAVRHQAFSVLREQAGFTYSLYASVDHIPAGPASLMLVMSTSPESAAPGAAAMRDLLAELSARPPSAEVATAAANRAEAGAWASGVDDRATSLALLRGEAVPRRGDWGIGAPRLGSLMQRCADAAFLGAVVPDNATALRVQDALE